MKSLRITITRAFPFALLTLLLPAGGYRLSAGPPRTPSAEPRPVITVEAIYPGANATSVADTVAAPIEQQVNGVEKLAYFRSRSTNDGHYTLHVVFAHGVDLNMAQVQVQNRVSLALPVLPDAVKQSGVSVKKGSAGVLAFVVLSSPDSRYDLLYLSNYATIQLKDELTRLPGVAEVTGLGERDFGMRIWLDADRLAALNLNAGDVISALEEQNVEVPAGPLGQPPGGKGQKQPLTVETLGRLTDPEQFGDVILKTSGAGHLVRLKDVARVELGGGAPKGHALLDGKPAVVLAIHFSFDARPREVSAAVRDRVSELRKALPEGLDLAVACDFTPNLEAADRPETPQYLLLDPTLPPSTSPERALEILRRCSVCLQQLPGVQNVLALTENPFDFANDRPCILVRLTATHGKWASRQEVARAVRKRLAEVDLDVTLRLRDLSGPGRFPQCGYPLELAVRGPEVDRVRQVAERLAMRLQQVPELTGVYADPASAPQPLLYLEVDRTRAATLGLDLKDVFSTLQVYTGGAAAGDLSRFGRTWQVTVQGDAAPGKRSEDFKQLKVRNDKGKMVPLAAVVTMHEVTGPRVIDRLDFQPMVQVTANPASGVSLAEARARCEGVAEQELSADYRLAWLQELSAAEPAPPRPAPAAADFLAPVVAVSSPVAREVTDYQDFTGRTQAVATVEIRARVSGYLNQVLFKEGSEVKKGDVLFEIDPRPYQAQLDQAVSQVQLSEAQLLLAQKVLERDQALAASAAGAISRQQLDQDKAAVNDALAHVKAEQAALGIYKLNLEFTRVLAPANGRIGRHFVDLGNLVKADDSILAVLVSQDPMYVNFDVDERTVLRLRRLAREGKIKSPQEAKTPVFLGLADEVDYPRRGTFDFVDNRLDPETGTVQVRAVFPNPDGLLSPGMFARVRLPIGASHAALLVVERALGSDQGLKFLYVVNDQNQVNYRRVTVGPLQSDGLVVIEQGLQTGDRVIVGGMQIVRPRMTVKPQVMPMPVLSPAGER